MGPGRFIKLKLIKKMTALLLAVSFLLTTALLWVPASLSAAELNSIFTEVKNSYPEEIDILYSYGATDAHIQAFIDDVEQQLIGSGQLDEANINNLVVDVLIDFYLGGQHPQVLQGILMGWNLDVFTLMNAYNAGGSQAVAALLPQSLVQIARLVKARVLAAEQDDQPPVILPPIIPTPDPPPAIESNETVEEHPLGVLKLAADGLSAVLEVAEGMLQNPADSGEPMIKVEHQARSVVVEVYLDEAREAATAGGLTAEINGLLFTLPLAALPGLGGSGNSGAEKLRLQVETVPAQETSSPDNMQPVGLVYSFTLTKVVSSASEDVLNFGSPVAVTLPVQAGIKIDPELIGVFRQQADGTWKYVGGRLTADGLGIQVSLPSFSSYRVMQYNGTFQDVPAGHWANRDIAVMASRQVALGDKGAFRPEDSITRAEFAALLARLLGLKAPAKLEGTFTDLKGTEWYAEAVASAVEAGLIKGFEDGTFRPREQITREQVAAMVVRALPASAASLGAEKVEQDLAAFADASEISQWARQSSALAAATGIVRGIGDKFQPKGLASRAQAVVMMRRLAHQLEK